MVKMTIKLVHVFLVVLTALLFLARQKYVCAGVAPTKRRSICPGCGDASLVTIRPLFKDYIVCAHSDRCIDTCHRPPKYKRDPDITVDNEDIGQHPHDY